MEGSLERVLCGKGGILQTVFDSEIFDVSIEERAETMELVEPVEQQKEAVNGGSGFQILKEPGPELETSCAFKYQNEC
ncbi:MAG: hypothetical protein DMG90_03600 [Acidobacteria bacterium]|nr:MAG: hypothetical protein DMG90_03600 [Acidobacteriota bacterium]